MTKNARSMASRVALTGPAEVAVPAPRRGPRPLSRESLVLLAETREGLAAAVAALSAAWAAVSVLEQEGHSRAQLREYLGPNAELAWALS